MIKRFLPFIFAGVLGLVAVVMMQQYLKQQRDLVEQERQRLWADYQAPVEVVVAKREIPEGTAVTAEDLEFLAIPEKFVEPYATRHPGDLLGMVAMVPIAEGEQLMTNKIRHPSEAPAGTTLSSLTPKGLRAVTMGADVITGVGGFVRPGDTVDVLWTLDVPEPGGEEANVVTLTLFQDVGVLAVDRQMVGQEGAEEEPEASEYTLTLALTPQETALLLYAREKGRVELSLRSRADKGEQVAIFPADMPLVMETILGRQPTTPEGPSLAPPQRTVEVYKGLERNLVTVNE